MAISPYPVNPDPEANQFYNNPNPNAENDYLQSHDPKNMYDTAHLRYEFTTNIAYIKAKQLFENGPKPDIWLTKLEQLVSSLSLPEGNFWSDVGNAFGNTYSNRYTEVLNNAFVSLNKLTNEWFEWFNKLPKEQRSQFEDAGLNVALDGGSQITGSEFTPQGIAPSPDFQGQQNQAFDNVVNFASSVSGGLLDLIGSVQNVFSLGLKRKEIKNNSDIALYNINKERIALGLAPFRTLSYARDSTIQDKDEMSDYGIAGSNEQEKKAKKSRTDLELNVNPLYNAVDDATRLNIGPYNQIMATLGNIQLGQSIYSQLFEQEKLAFDRKKLEIQSKIQDTYGESLALGEAQTTLAEQSYKQTDFRTSAKLKEFGETLYDYKKSVLQDWIQKANSDSSDAFIYSSLLMKSGLSLSEFMGPAEVGLDYLNKGSAILDDLLGIFNPVKWLKPKKIVNTSKTTYKTTNVYK